MKQIKISKTIVILFMLTLVATLLGLQTLTSYDNKYTEKSLVSQEGASLLPDNGLSFLVDEWMIYPDQLLTSDDFKKDSPTPGFITWAGEFSSLAPFHKDGNPYGSATYRLVLQGSGVTSLYLQEPLCAARVFVNGTDMGGPGDVSLENYRPLIEDTVYSFVVDGEAELIIQTSNYSHYYGGLWFPPAIGSPDSINRMISLRMIFYGLFSFAPLSLALFSMALWHGKKQKRDKGSFWFGLLCFSFGLRMCYPFLRCWGVPLVQSLYALEDGFSLLGIYCTVRLALLFFIPQSYEKLHKIAAILSLGMCGVAITIPLAVMPLFPGFNPIYGQLISWYKVLVAIFLMIAALWGCIKDRPHARPVLVAVTANGVCLLWGVLNIGQFEPIIGAWPEEYGAACMVIAFAWLMIRRSKAMTEENIQLNKNLQEKVEEKTKHLSLLLYERGQLMAELGHDMKSPLTAMSNMTQIIRMNSILLDADSQLKLKGIEDKCDELASRVSSLQELSGQTSTPIQMEPLSLNQFLSNFHRSNQPVVELMGPDFVLECTPIPCTVLADKAKLSRALENLVFNATEFTLPEGRITLSLKLQDNFAFIRVADTGCGIPATELPKVFQRFYSTRQSEGGQGLGLAITRAIVLEHGGEITVESTVGKGSVFIIKLPLLEA